MNRRRATWVLVVAALAGCQNKSIFDEDGAKPRSKTEDKAEQDKGVDAPPKREPLTAAKLGPVIHELGADGAVPTSVVIQLAQPIIDRSDVGQVTPKTKVNITPNVAGTVSYTGVSELTFTPSRPFDFDTSYKVDLAAVETRDGVLEAPAPDQWGAKWSYSFKTPKFAFLGWAPSDLDLTKNTANMEITFSGAVLPNIARASMTFTVDGKALTNVLGVPTRQQNVVAVQLKDPRIKLGAKLGLSIKKDMASLLGAKLPEAVKADFQVSSDKAISIKTIQVVEGTNGFYVEVVCDDKAAEDGNRSWYSGGDSYYDLSQRCQLADASRISFTPAVKKVYVTSGRAGFRVFGDFKRGVYKMKIAGGATSVDGGVLLAAFNRTFSVSARKPQLSFAASGRYLPRTAWNNLGIKHLNTEAINLVVRHVPAENLVFWLGNESSEAADERTSNVILKKEIPLRGDPDEATTSWIDVGTLLPRTTKGVLELRVAGVGANSVSRLLLTNMSLVAKKTPTPDKPWLQKVQVWALDMDSNELLGDVEISLVRKSGKTVARCTTSSGSGCTMETKEGDPDEAEPFALIARRGDDLTYIRYKDLRADVVESSTSGVPYVASTPYRGSIFSDRGVYRPGDTAHVTAIVRDGKDKAPDAGLPVDIKLVDPRAKVAKKMTLKTNAAGVISFDHVMPAFADTGHWRVAMTVADKPLAAYDLQVEEFVPERMKVQLASKVQEALVGTNLEFDVAARYLFGGSALDSGVELACSIEPTRFVPDQNQDLTYGVEPKGKPVSLGEPSRGQLDPAGRLSIACPEPDENTTFTQTGELTATASVLEAGSGRATVKTATVMLHPEKYYLGVRTKNSKASAGETFQVEGLVVDWTGKPLPAAIKQVEIEMVHLEADYSYGYDEDTGESRYDRWLREVPEGKATAKVENGKFVFDVTPGEAYGGYLVRVKAGKARTDLVLDGEYSYDYYGYGDGNRYDATPRPAKPTQLKIDVPKEIKVGETVTAKIKTPYKGKVLWTVETDHVVTAQWQDVTAAEASWSFKLAEFAPNVYVSAFLVKDPHLESRDAFMPDRAYGVKSTRVSPVAYTQDVKIEAPREIRSSSPLNIKLDLGPSAAGTVAVVSVVDEGILSLTNFQTPDPLAQLFSKRALGVETYETLGWTMLHQPAGASSKTGGGDYEEDEEGGGGALEGGRVQPVKPVALFSGVLPVGPDGKVSVPFHVPTYRGELRIMAITAGPTKIGRAEAKVTVKDPLVIQVTFPRFVTQGDEMQIPVFMTNMSGGPLDVQVTLGSSVIPIAGLAYPKTAQAPLTFAGKDTGSIRIQDGLAETLVFRANANMPIGGAKLRVVAKAKGKAGAFEVADEVEVPFLPSGPKERVVQKIQVKPGKLDLASQAALENWVPTSEQTTFWLTSNPYGESFDHLKYLIHYPYGCIEQTTSSTRPLLYVGSIVEQVDPQLAQLKIEDMVLSGINRILSMETPSGGFAYWPGSTEPVEWGTAYATHMLLDAKKLGYAVPEDRLQAVLTWIENRAAERESGSATKPGAHYHFEGRHYDLQAEAYLHYVLALGGKGKKARILKLIELVPAKTTDGEEQEAIYMLKAALYLAGDRRYAADLKNVDASPVAKERINSWSFYSDRRRRGMQLSIFFDLFGKDPAGEVLATRVAEMLTAERDSYYYNTQELVWGITGLGKWVTGSVGKGTAAGTLVADGVTIDPRKMKLKTNDKSWSLMRASEYKSLTLDIPQQADGMWLVIRSEGVRPGGDYKVGGNGLSVKRTYRDSAGTEIDLTKGDVQLGEVLYVEVEVENTSGQQIQNLALVDRLPAGFEVENPRLGRGFKVDWVEPDEQWVVDFLNMRDDRLEAFGTLKAGESKKIVYTVRAVTSGTYTVPPVELEAMYDPTLWAREKGGKAIVGGPWTGKLL